MVTMDDIQRLRFIRDLRQYDYDRELLFLDQLRRQLVSTDCGEAFVAIARDELEAQMLEYIPAARHALRQAEAELEAAEYEAAQEWRKGKKAEDFYDD